MKTFSILLFFILAMASLSVWASDVGSIKNVTGHAWIIRGEKELFAKPGTRLMVGDSMKTGRDGAMGIVLRDDTIISMGTRSQMVLAEFEFQPEEKRLGMLTRFLKGTFTYISGAMAKISPEAVKVETPVSKVVIRGTHFLIKVE